MQVYSKNISNEDINNKTWELNSHDCSCYSPKKNCSHKSGVFHCISGKAVVGEGPVWLAVSTSYGHAMAAI